MDKKKCPYWDRMLVSIWNVVQGDVQMCLPYQETHKGDKDGR